MALKRRGARRDLLVMGPECGTAMLAGVGLGFANVVRPGPVGIVAAAGTGAQEVACLLDAAGSGVSHIIGVGGRDLSTTVGGTMVRQGLALLARDESTRTLLLVAKEPQALDALAGAVPAGLRAVAALVGWEGRLPGWEVHPTLEAAALAAAGAPVPDDDLDVDPRPGRVLGLYSGGSLAHEACVVLEPLVGTVATEPEAVDGDDHVVLDLGTERYTQGRPHPMVDFGVRLELLEAAIGDGRTACVLLDVVCGHGAHPDPASELAGAIARAAAGATVVARVCGTDADPQDAGRQAAALRRRAPSSRRPTRPPRGSRRGRSREDRDAHLLGAPARRGGARAVGRRRAGGPRPRGRAVRDRAAGRGLLPHAAGAGAGDPPRRARCAVRRAHLRADRRVHRGPARVRCATAATTSSTPRTASRPTRR